MKTISPANPKASPRTALAHLRSSDALDSGAGIALRSLFSSIRKTATPKAYNTSEEGR